MGMEILDAEKHDSRHCGPSFTLSHRIYRLAWSTVWKLAASWTPRRWHRWRGSWLRAFGASIAPDAIIDSSAQIWSPINLTVCANAFVGPDVVLYSMAHIKIGPGAKILRAAHICAGTHDVDDIHFQLKAFPITIGRGALVSTRAFVGPGVVIGDGAVLEAMGCAFGDLEPWTINAGNPAKIVGQRTMPGDRLDK